MPFNPVDNYRFASLLYEQNDDTKYPESCTRTTISRAYYSAFIAARDNAKIIATQGSVHQQVIDYYKTPKMQQLANNLNDLRALRTCADYHMNEKLTTHQSQNALKFARKILEKLNIDLTITT